VAIPGAEKFENFGTIHERDGHQTDGQTLHDGIGRAHGKNQDVFVGTKPSRFMHPSNTFQAFSAIHNIQLYSAFGSH